jgi:hypothetical protein
VAFIFSYSHFYVQNCRFRALFCRFTANQVEIQKYFSFDVHQPLDLLHSENDGSGISTEKALYQNVGKTPFSAHSNRLVTPEAKIKNSSDSLKFRQFYGFSPNLKTFRYKL